MQIHADLDPDPQPWFDHTYIYIPYGFLVTKLMYIDQRNRLQKQNRSSLNKITRNLHERKKYQCGTLEHGAFPL